MATVKELEKQIEESEKELSRAVNVNRVLPLILRNQIAIMKRIKLEENRPVVKISPSERSILDRF